MLGRSPDEFHRELDMLSQRLQAIRQEFREHGMVSDADQNVLNRVQEEKDGLEVKLSDAERSGQWDAFRGEFGSIWNSFITDVEMLELRVMNNEMTKHKTF